MVADALKKENDEVLSNQKVKAMSFELAEKSGRK